MRRECLKCSKGQTCMLVLLIFLLPFKVSIYIVITSLQRSIGMAAEMAISSAVELLGDLLIEKVKFLQGVEGKVELLKDELNRMQAFLRDANKKQAENERVRNWISEIRELAQDAEDTIEMFLLNVKNKRCSSSPNCVCQLHTIGEAVQSIQERLDEIEKSRRRYGIKDLGDAAGADGDDDSTRLRAQFESQRRLAFWKPDEQVVGMEDKIQQLLRESVLDEEKKGLSVAVVEGMGGIGKSTLARTIYNHPDVVKGRFDCRAWVVVSSEFTPQETIKQLILQLPGPDVQMLRELDLILNDKLHLQDMLQQMLHKQLQGKTYFVVLDDVWEHQHLGYLREAFPDEQDKTSRLLITTRNKVIAKYGQYTLDMKVLDPEKSWELLLKKAFINYIDDKRRKDLESIGRKILEKCGGLPLAINMVGGLLAGKQNQSEWEEVLNQINSYLEGPESNVSSILELSYLNLSPQLKSCFLCLAFFKEDATIPTKRLTHIWVGQGLIQQEGGRTVDEIARSYLDELINRNLVRIKDLTFHDRVKNCQLHDLIREVCLRRAEKEIGFEMLTGGERIPSKSSYKPRHRVVHIIPRAFSLDGNKHLRSLFLLGNSFRTPQARYWKSFQLLKILDLERFTLRRLPTSFRALIGLKYLRLGNDLHDLLELPSWLGHLRKLEVIDIGHHIVKFPYNTLEMDRLVCFRAYTVYGLPARIENWRSIETLKYIRQVDFVQCFSRLMAAGCHVRKLGIHLDLKRPPEELSSLIASLEKMENLAQLHLRWNGTFQLDNKLIPHHPSLTKLTLRGKMSRCPSVSMFPPNLTHLTLRECNLGEDPMEELGRLPRLLHLKLSYSAYKGLRMQVFHGGFPYLEALSLKDLPPLTVINIERGGMPHLKHLRIFGCCNLQALNIPAHINMDFVATA